MTRTGQPLLVSASGKNVFRPNSVARRQKACGLDLPQERNPEASRNFHRESLCAHTIASQEEESEMSSLENPDEPSAWQETSEDVSASGKAMEKTSCRSNGADGMSSHSDWRDLAQKIEEEKDPTKVIELAQQLIAVIDEKRLGKSPRREP
jgi:hypothetical protein